MKKDKLQVGKIYSFVENEVMMWDHPYGRNSYVMTLLRDVPFLVLDHAKDMSTWVYVLYNGDKLGWVHRINQEVKELTDNGG